MTFVEKYVSVSASGGTGRVATSVSCFGGLGQLYRVKVWAVSGLNISQQPAVQCLTPDGQCREEGGKQTRSIFDYIKHTVCTVKFFVNSISISTYIGSSFNLNM